MKNEEKKATFSESFIPLQVLITSNLSDISYILYNSTELNGINVYIQYYV